MKLYRIVLVVFMLTSAWVMYAQENNQMNMDLSTEINTSELNIKNTSDTASFTTNAALINGISALYENDYFIINLNKPNDAARWRLSVSEFTGQEIYSTQGDVWPAQGLVWDYKAQNVELFSGIFYVVSVSFFNAQGRFIKSEASKFYVPLMMKDNKAPLIFFDGDTTDVSDQIYEDSSTKALFDFIIDKAQNEFVDDKILIRGHAAFISTSEPERKLEQIDLLELSKDRAVSVLDKLAEYDIDLTRVYYESFGGADELSSDVNERWQNRRVEVVFVQNVDSQAVKLKTTKEMEAEKILSDKYKVEIEPEREVEPWSDVPILGVGQIPPDHILKFILYYTPTEDPKYIDYLKRIIMYYINESRTESVNYDVAIAQMLLETNFLRFTGQIRKEQYNFAGIGAINDANVGNWFSTELIGVRAHIQHLKAYATPHPLRGDLVDPRYPILDRLGLLGSSPLVSNLAGRWASDPNYSIKILKILRRMYNYSNALIDKGF